MKARILLEPQAKGNPAGASAVAEKGQIEAGSVPGGENPRRQFANGPIQVSQELLFRSIEHPTPTVTGESDRHDRRRGRVEAASGCVGFDIEAVGGR